MNLNIVLNTLSCSMKVVHDTHHDFVAIFKARGCLEHWILLQCCLLHCPFILQTFINTRILLSKKKGCIHVSAVLFPLTKPYKQGTQGTKHREGSAHEIHPPQKQLGTSLQAVSFQSTWHGKASKKLKIRFQNQKHSACTSFISITILEHVKSPRSEAATWAKELLPVTLKLKDWLGLNSFSSCSCTSKIHGPKHHQTKKSEKKTAESIQQTSLVCSQLWRENTSMHSVYILQQILFDLAAVHSPYK